jgi:hypothetical protein
MCVARHALSFLDGREAAKQARARPGQQPEQEQQCSPAETAAPDAVEERRVVERRLPHYLAVRAS